MNEHDYDANKFKDYFVRLVTLSNVIYNIGKVQYN